MTGLRGVAAWALALPIVLALAGCATIEAPAGGGGRPSLADAVQRLPAEAAGFIRGASTEYERERPGLGVGVDYATANRVAVGTVYLYDRGLDTVPEDPMAPAITAELDQAVGEAIALAPSARRGRRLAEQGRETLPVPGGPGLRCATLRGTFGREPVLNRICLGEAGGRFLKVQVTMAERQSRAGEADTFAAAIAQAARRGG